MIVRKTILFLSLNIVVIFFAESCSLNFIKKRLSPPHRIKNGILFQYDAPSARQVNLAGNFPDNEWLKYGNQFDVMRDDGKNGDRVSGDGIWSIVKLLSPGRYEYKFVVDRNSWVVDPNALETADDGYGGKNSVLIVK
jgi:1,4-alpha-glucan branching enzyme